MTEFSMSAAYY